ncbi:MAG: RNA-binding S4 domain-containing protein [Clostridiales bacterium]|nr:RNA-binding S4 domain-containing protein [Clostridiales bacterium]
MKISTEYITLDAALKFSNVVSTGGEAKMLIASGQVRVNGEICLQRGKKLRPGDSFEVSGESFVIV